MRALTIGLLAGACAMALAGCGEKDEEAAKASGAAPAAPAGSPTNPQPRAGLWEQTMTADGAGTMTVKVCVGENTTNTLSGFGGQTNETCPDSKVERAGDGWKMQTTCNLGSGGTVQSAATISGDFSTSYTAEATSTVTGAEVPQMNRTTTSRMTAKWLGPCPAEMSPGAVDYGNIIVDSSGMKPPAK